MDTGESRRQTTFRSEAFFSALVVGVFLVLGVIGLRHHAMWRDETDPWLIGRASGTLREALLVRRYDGHFLLWQSLVWILAQLTHHCEALQWFHLGLAAIGVWLVLWFGRFTRIQKALYCFGYFTLFEYCLVCREYVCVVLLVFSLCALYDRRRDDFVAQAVVLLLLANTNVFAIVIGITFVVARVVEEMCLGRMRELWATRKRGVVVSGLILMLALVGDGIQLKTLPGALASTGRPTSIAAADFAKGVCNVWRGYVPLPVPFPHTSYMRHEYEEAPAAFSGIERFYWGTNSFLDPAPARVMAGVVLSLGLLVVSAWSLWRSRLAVTWYLLGVCMLLVFQSVIGSGALRHHGLYLILYLACVWCRGIPSGDSGAEMAATGWSRRLGGWFLTLVLVVQAVAGVYVWTILLQAPFSGSKAAADYIREHGYMKLPIVGTREANVSPVAAYLDRRIWYPDSERSGTYYDERGAKHAMAFRELLQKVFVVAQAERSDVLLLLTDRMKVEGKVLDSGWLVPSGGVVLAWEAPAGPHLKVTHLAGFRATVDEEYNLYLFQQP